MWVVRTQWRIKPMDKVDKRITKLFGQNELHPWSFLNLVNNLFATAVLCHQLELLVRSHFTWSNLVIQFENPLPLTKLWPEKMKRQAEIIKPGKVQIEQGYQWVELKDAIASISCCKRRASTNKSKFSPTITSLIEWWVIPTRWSVTRPCGKLYVLMRSDLSPLPICSMPQTPP